MGNLIKKVKEVTLDDEIFLVTADMRSIATYKDLTGQSFLQSISKLAEMDDELLLNLAAATTRRKEEPEKVLGTELLENYNPFAILLNFTEAVIEILGESMPNAKGALEKK